MKSPTQPSAGINKYPKPPFPYQPQKPPGLASKMKPRPDHGETSYRGAGRLAGRKALAARSDGFWRLAFERTR